jgi:hypothetical protein
LRVTAGICAPATGQSVERGLSMSTSVGARKMVTLGGSAPAARRCAMLFSLCVCLSLRLHKCLHAYECLHMSVCFCTWLFAGVCDRMWLYVSACQTVAPTGEARTSPAPAEKPPRRAPGPKNPGPLAAPLQGHRPPRSAYAGTHRAPKFVLGPREAPPPQPGTFVEVF